MHYRTYPVLVLGGGPAGLSTAFELAQRGLGVTVVERGTYEGVRIGEHLSPAGVLRLREISSKAGMPLCAHFESSGVVAYWGSETPSFMDYFLHSGQHGLNLSRPQFDADFALACEFSGVTILRSASLLRAKRDDPGWNIEILVGDKVIGLAAGIVIDATGRAAGFARRQGARIRASDRQVAVIAFATGCTKMWGHSRSIVEAVENGWWYEAAISLNRSICMFVTDHDLLPQGPKSKWRLWWHEQLRCTRQISVEAYEFPENLIFRSARSQHLDVASGAGWFAIGDAALAFDPLSSQGLSNALDQGKQAASAICAYISGDASSIDDFVNDLQARYRAYCTMRSQYYRLETRWMHSSFWKRRHIGCNTPQL